MPLTNCHTVDSPSLAQVQAYELQNYRPRGWPKPPCRRERPWQAEEATAGSPQQAHAMGSSRMCGAGGHTRHWNQNMHWNRGPKKEGPKAFLKKIGAGIKRAIR